MAERKFDYANVGDLTVDAQELLALVTRMVLTRDGLDKNRPMFSGPVGEGWRTMGLYDDAVTAVERALVNVLQVKARVKRDLGSWNWNDHEDHCTICGLFVDKSLKEVAQPIEVPVSPHRNPETHIICEDCLREAGVE